MSDTNDTNATNRRAVAVVRGEFPTPLDDGTGKVRTVTQVIDAASVAAIVAAYAADPRPLLVDADHGADNGGSTEAYAWASDLRGKDGGVEVLLEPTDLGADAIANRRYRFLSPVFEQADLEWLDAAKTRARPLRLARISLTNRPNTPLPALVNSAAARAGQARQNANEGTRSMDYKALLLATLGLADDATDEAIQSAVDALAAKKAEADADAAVNAAEIPDEAKADAKKAVLAAPAATNAVLGAVKAACNAVAGKAKADAAAAAKPAQRVLLNSQGRQPAVGASDKARLRSEALNAHAAANPAMSRDAVYNAVRSTHPELF